MGILAVFLIALGLSLDSFAVSLTTGLLERNIRFWQAARIASVLAVFQGVLPVIGWFIGSQLDELIRNYDHWVAFGLLFLIGARMIADGFRSDREKRKFDPLKPAFLVGIALSTSMDAFVVGISLAFVEVNILMSALVIGLVTWVVSMLGILSGKQAGNLLGRKIEAIGGSILIAIGLKILLEHLLG